MISKYTIEIKLTNERGEQITHYKGPVEHSREELFSASIKLNEMAYLIGYTFEPHIKFDRRLIEKR